MVAFGSTNDVQLGAALKRFLGRPMSDLEDRFLVGAAVWLRITECMGPVPVSGHLVPPGLFLASPGVGLLLRWCGFVGCAVHSPTCGGLLMELGGSSVSSSRLLLSEVSATVFLEAVSPARVSFLGASGRWAFCVQVVS